MVYRKGLNKIAFGSALCLYAAGAGPIPLAATGLSEANFEAGVSQQAPANNCAEVIAYGLIDRGNINWRKLRVVTAIETSLQLDDQLAYFELRDELRAAVPNDTMRTGLLENAISIKEQAMSNPLCN